MAETGGFQTGAWWVPDLDSLVSISFQILCVLFSLTDCPDIIGHFFICPPLSFSSFTAEDVQGKF